MNRNPITSDDLLFRLEQWWRSRSLARSTNKHGPKQHPEFIKAAHYFSDGWPLNMWQVMQPGSVAAELNTIIKDGFNTIILVVPWRGFQVDQEHPRYDPFYIRQLRRVLTAADRQDLSVIVRVAYSHHLLLDNTPNGISMAQRLLLNPVTKEAWLHYLNTLHQICSGYRSFHTGFFCWEELWHAFGAWQTMGQDAREELAAESGFIDFLAEQGVDRITAIPTARESTYQLYNEFINTRIRDFFEMGRGAFPGLSMEFRVDKDLLCDGEESRWLSNDNYSDLPGHRYSYWAPFMGAENVGEQLNAEHAAWLFDYMLQEVSELGENTRHIVDQFNFVDQAPRFKGIHAEIEHDEIAEFLELAAPLLKKLSGGYGVWAYRDYCQNVLYNPRFLMGMSGWETLRGKVTPHKNGGIRMSKGALIKQTLAPVPAGLQRIVPFDQLTLRVVLQSATVANHLSVRINSGQWHTTEAEALGNNLYLEISVNNQEILDTGLTLDINNLGSTLALECLYLSHYVYRGDIRDEEGAASAHLKAIRTFNTLMDILPGPECPPKTALHVEISP
jgi:hypothetical protein